MITVAQLVKALQTFPQDAEVILLAGPDLDCNIDLEVRAGNGRYLVISEDNVLYDAQGIVKST